MNQSKLLSIDKQPLPVNQGKIENNKGKSSNSVEILNSNMYCYETSKMRPVDVSPNPFMFNLKNRLLQYGGYEEVWNDDFIL